MWNIIAILIHIIALVNIESTANDPPEQRPKASRISICSKNISPATVWMAHDSENLRYILSNESFALTLPVGVRPPVVREPKAYTKSCPILAVTSTWLVGESVDNKGVNPKWQKPRKWNRLCKIRQGIVNVQHGFDPNWGLHKGHPAKHNNMCAHDSRPDM